MSKVKFANNAVSALAASVSSGATSFVVTTSFGALFPTIGAGEEFYVRIGTDTNNEVVRVSARSGDTFTCDATSQSWDNGTAVALTVTNEALEKMAQLDGGGTTFEDHTLKNIAEVKTAPTISSGTLTLSLSASNVFEVTLDADITTLTISNVPASGKLGFFTLFMKQDATGGRSVTWPASVQWNAAIAPTISTDANAVDIFTFMTMDGGTTWYAMTGGQAFGVPA